MFVESVGNATYVHFGRFVMESHFAYRLAIFLIVLGAVCIALICASVVAHWFFWCKQNRRIKDIISQIDDDKTYETVLDTVLGDRGLVRRDFNKLFGEHVVAPSNVPIDVFKRFKKKVMKICLRYVFVPEKMIKWPKVLEGGNYDYDVEPLDILERWDRASLSVWHLENPIRREYEETYKLQIHADDYMRRMDRFRMYAMGVIPILALFAAMSLTFGIQML